MTDPRPTCPSCGDRRYLITTVCGSCWMAEVYEASKAKQPTVGQLLLFADQLAPPAHTKRTT